MKLFFKSGACSLSPHIVLEELGLPYEAVAVDLKTKTLADGSDYLAINSKGYVPALQLDSGEVLAEGPAIVQYLADQKPEKKLAPANGTVERYRVQSWLTFIGTEIHKSFSPLFNAAMPEDAKTIARANLTRRLGWVNEQLTGKDYLTGADFTVADAYLFTVTRWAGAVKLDISAFTNLTAYMARVAARPGVKGALKAEGLA